MLSKFINEKVIHRNMSQAGFRESAHVGSWEDLDGSLEGEKAFVPLEDNGEHNKGDFTVIDDDPEVVGVYLPAKNFEDNTINRDDRYPGGFHFRNNDDDPIELKFRFSDELRSYPELKHVHNVPELYVADGAFEMDVAINRTENRELEYENVTIEDEAFVVPRGMYHGITSMEEGSDLVVVRGDPKHEIETVGKWCEDYNQLYEHAESLKFPELSFYNPGKDEMHRL